MFNFIHHVRILVHNADDMVTYMEQTFNMTPLKVQVYESRGMKNAIYKVGQTNLELTEPLDANAKMGKLNSWSVKALACITSRSGLMGSKRWPRGWWRKAIN